MAARRKTEAEVPDAVTLRRPSVWGLLGQGLARSAGEIQILLEGH